MRWQRLAGDGVVGKGSSSPAEKKLDAMLMSSQYAALKAHAADEHIADREAYSEAKAEFVRRVLA